MEPLPALATCLICAEAVVRPSSDLHDGGTDGNTLSEMLSRLPEQESRPSSEFSSCMAGAAKSMTLKQAGEIGENKQKADYIQVAFSRRSMGSH